MEKCQKLDQLEQLWATFSTIPQRYICQLSCKTAGTMNSFFIDKVARRRESIPQVNSDPLAKLRESMRKRTCTMKFGAVAPDVVLDIIIALKNSKSTGVDYLDTWSIKLVAEDILPAITHIINLSNLHHAVQVPHHVEAGQSCTSLEER